MPGDTLLLKIEAPLSADEVARVRAALADLSFTSSHAITGDVVRD